MIGLGVGIDYALFILTRFREAYCDARADVPRRRASRSCRRSTPPARAVLFAGCTVVIALLGMMLLGVSFLYGVAISASIGVLMVMLGSLTLLPALLTIAGRARGGRQGAAERRRASARSGRRRERASGRGRGVAALERVSSSAGRGAIAIVATLVMLVIAAPAIALRLGSSDASNDPAGQTTHRAYVLLGGGLRRRLQRTAAGRGEGSAAGREAASNGVLLTVPANTGVRGAAAALGDRRHAGRGRRGAAADQPGR